MSAPATASATALAFPYRFTAPVQAANDDNPTYHYHRLAVPAELVAYLQSRKLRRLIGTFNGRDFNLALHGRATDAVRHLFLSRKLVRELKAQVGTPITVECHPDENPDEVALPEELLEVFYLEPEAFSRYQSLTPGRQRSLVIHITNAKTIDTRIKRALELAHKLRTHTLYGDLNPEKR